MRRFFLLFVCFLCALNLTYAQRKKEKKGSFYWAKISFQNNKLERAKKEIDLLVQDPKKAKSVGVWMFHGKIYRAILVSDEFAVRRLDKKAGVTAAKSFAKVMALKAGKKESASYVEAYNTFEELWGHYVQQGINYYKVEDYKKAYHELLLSTEIKPEDSVSHSYAGYFASLLKDYDKTLLHYHKLIELDKATLDVYKEVVNLERNHTKNLSKVTEILSQARQRFPDERFFLKEALLVLIQQKKTEQVEEEIEKVVEKVSDDPQVLLHVASFYQDQADPFVKAKDFDAAFPYLEKAVSYYAKALVLRPENLVANFNVSLAYQNMSEKYYYKARQMDNATYTKKGRAMEEEGKAIISQSLPYLEKSYELSPNDMDVLVALRQTSHLMGMKEKVAEYQKKIEALEKSEAEE